MIRDAAAGGVGQFVVQLAKARYGLYVVGTCSPKNAELVKKLGADEVRGPSLLRCCAAPASLQRSP